jgi:hypothetical protein
LVGIALISSPAVAQSAPSAREHFAHGIELVQSGDLDSGTAEFEEAYRISPNYLVLYNLGQAYVALGKPVEAVRAFTEYLELGGTKVPKARRQEVEDLVRLSSKRIGSASLSVEPSGGEVFVDGRSLGEAPLGEPVALIVGTHSVSVAAAGYEPFITSMEILPGKTTALAIHLRPETPPASPTIGQLVVTSAIPDARITLDGALVSIGAPDPLLLATGHHEIRCERDGYLTWSTSAEVSTQGVAHATCNLVPIANLSASQAGILVLAIDETRAEVRIDGRQTGTTVRLPHGSHTVSISRTGFKDWTHRVSVQPGFPLTLKVHLRPTPAHEAELSEAARSRRNWAYLIGGAGLSIVGASAVLYANNSSRYAAWERDDSALSSDIQNEHWNPTLSTRAGELQSRAVSIQERDDLALGLGVVGGALVGYAVVSWLQAQN